jgi:hypothetical protein
MAVQIKKTYRGVNTEMLRDEIRDMVQKLGLTASDTRVQTYSLPSGSTQSRVTLIFKAQARQKEERGYAHIMGSPGGETRMLLELDEKQIPQETLSALQEELDFMLGPYEVKW